MLRAARVQQGQELLGAADVLRIRPAYLVAIEDGRFSELPGSTYAIGFVRSYAEHLGLDPDDVVARFKSESAGGLDKRPELVFPSPVSEGRTPGGAIIFLGLLLAALAYGGWYYLSTRDRGVAELVPALPDRLAAIIEPDAPPLAPAEEAEPLAAQEPVPDTTPAAVPASEETATPAPAAIPDEQPPSPAEAEPPVAAPQPAPDSAPDSATAHDPAPAEAPPPSPADAAPPQVAVPALPDPGESGAGPDGRRIYGQNNAGSRITLRAIDDAWIQVRDEETLLLTRLLRKGDLYLVPNRSGLTLMTGSAGGIEVVVDGSPAPSLGALGVVRRDVPLDPEKLKAGL